MKSFDLSAKPWDAPSADIPKEIYLPKGMLGPEERRCLFWIARDHFSNRGAIVDAGAFVGASAYCFASGLHDSKLFRARCPVVHSFDYFKAVDDYVVKTLSADFRTTNVGDTYLDIFEWQTGKHKDLIQIHAGDFITHEWSGESIEVLFIDIAKTQELNSHLVRQMFPALIPKHSVVIQQDFFHCWHPHIHVTMEALSDHFEVIDPHVQWSSRLYKYSNELSQAEIDEVAAYRFSYEEKLGLLHKLAARETGSMKAMAEVVWMWQMVLEQDWDRFFREHHAFWNRWPRSSSELWARQLGELLALTPHFDALPAGAPDLGRRRVSQAIAWMRARVPGFGKS
jgi:hypothetical protein